MVNREGEIDFDEKNGPAMDQSVETAIRIITSNLRRPTKSIPFHSSFSTISGREIIDVNNIYPLALAWNCIDPAIAESLVKCVFFMQDSDGAIASRYLPDGMPLTSEAPWPLLIQTARKIWERNRNMDFLEAVMPRMYRYADWICYHFDPDQTGIPRWQSSEESLMPSVFSPHVAAPDLSILLLCELEALKHFESERPAVFRDNLYVRPEMDKLTNLIQNYFWDHSRNECSFKNIRDHSRLPAPLFYTALITMSRSVSPEIRMRAKPILSRALRNMMSPELWPNSESFRLNGVYALLLIDAAEEAGMQAECMQFCRQIGATIRKHHRSTGNLPEVIAFDSENRNDSMDSSGTSNPLIMSTVAVYSDAFLKRYGSQASLGSRLLNRLNRHPVLNLSIPLALAAIIFFSVALLTILKKAPTGADINASMGLANRFYETGEYEEALDISERFIDNDLDSVYTDLIRAKILYKMGEYDEAEKIYRKMLGGDAPYPSIYLNLALLEYKRNRFDEAIDMYGDFIEKHGDVFPYEAERAEQAMDLLKHSSYHLEPNGD